MDGEKYQQREREIGREGSDPPFPCLSIICGPERNFRGQRYWLFTKVSYRVYMTWQRFFIYFFLATWQRLLWKFFVLRILLLFFKNGHWPSGFLVYEPKLKVMNTFGFCLLWGWDSSPQAKITIDINSTLIYAVWKHDILQPQGEVRWGFVSKESSSATLLCFLF